jgi:hypothetical protein
MNGEGPLNGDGATGSVSQRTGMSTAKESRNTSFGVSGCDARCRNQLSAFISVLNRERPIYGIVRAFGRALLSFELSFATGRSDHQQICVQGHRDERAA